MKKLLVTAIFIALAAAPAIASASILQIQFQGLDIAYNGSAIYDQGGPNTASGGGSTANADPLTAMNFLVDGSPAGPIMTSNIFADLYIPNVYDIPAAGGVVQSQGPFPVFGFDVLTDNGAGGVGLQFSEPVQITWDGTALTVGGSARTTSLTGQNLPYGLVLGTPVDVSFSSNTFGDFGSTEGYLTRFTASGTGEVDGPLAVPEPATLMLLGFGLLGGGAAAARRRKKTT